MRSIIDDYRRMLAETTGAPDEEGVRWVLVAEHHLEALLVVAERAQMVRVMVRVTLDGEVRHVPVGTLLELAPALESAAGDDLLAGRRVEPLP